MLLISCAPPKACIYSKRYKPPVNKQSGPCKPKPRPAIPLWK